MNFSRNVEELMKITNDIKDILLNILSLKHDRSTRDKISEYVYRMISIMEISNVFYRIVYEKDNKNSFTKTDHPLNFIVSKYPTKLQTLSQKLFDKPIEELKLENVNEIIKNFSEKNDNTEHYIEYLNELKQLDLGNTSWSKEKLEDTLEKISQNKFEMAILKADEEFRVIDKKRPDGEELKRIIVNLDAIRVDVEE